MSPRGRRDREEWLVNFETGPRSSSFFWWRDELTSSKLTAAAHKISENMHENII